MPARPHPTSSVTDYLAIERTGLRKHEYYWGDIFALARCSGVHNLIPTTILTGLNVQLRNRRCIVYLSDRRLSIPAIGLYTYSDVSVMCGPLSFADHERDTPLNSRIIVKILSSLFTAMSSWCSRRLYLSRSSATNNSLLGPKSVIVPRELVVSVP